MVFANVRKVVKIVPPPPPPPLPPDHAHMEVLLVMKVCMFRLNHGIQSRSAAARRRARDLPARILTRGGRLERWCGVESAVRPGAGAVDSPVPPYPFIWMHYLSSLEHVFQCEKYIK